MSEFELKKRFFREGDSFDISSLSDEEYNYFSNYLATQRTITKSLTVLYFDKQWYNIVKGYNQQNFNSQNSLINEKYKVEIFKRISVKDDLLTKLNKELRLTPNQLIVTNINTNSILARKISLQGDYDLLQKNLPSDINRCYEDLIGSIESQPDFFVDDTFFKEQVKIIHESKQEKMPYTIVALILWYSSFALQ